MSESFSESNSRQFQWLALLRCVECGSSLERSGEELVCTRCRAAYQCVRGRPILLRQGNVLFPPDTYLEEAPKQRVERQASIRAMLKGLVPSRSVNLARESTCRKIAAGVCADAHVLVIGCGRQRRALESLFDGEEIRFVFSDIDRHADCDLFCDAHELPFADGAFDGVITTAVMEHVLEPWIVAAEIGRVVREGGFVYSEVPFLQGVHEGAYDFTRFTLGGHRALFRQFREVEAGPVAGPGTALVWAATGFAESIFQSRRLAQLANCAVRVSMGWIKHLDRWIGRRPSAVDSASCTYFWGVKVSETASPREIIARYDGRAFSH